MSDPVFRSDANAVEVIREYRAVLDHWPVPRQEIELPTSHGATFVLACGPETAPPVVLLHGAQANSAAWLPDIALWSSRFRLYAVDMIGEAGLSARVRPPLTGGTYALWLDDVFTGLGLARAPLVGTSLGGWLALDYAVRRPARASALALICPAGIGRQKNFLLAAAPYLLLGAWGKRKIVEKVFGPAAVQHRSNCRLILQRSPVSWIVSAARSNRASSKFRGSAMQRWKHLPCRSSPSLEVATCSSTLMTRARGSSGMFRMPKSVSLRKVITSCLISRSECSNSWSAA
jgi:pimeloyl-ACP methyl ester carboxylesterase